MSMLAERKRKQKWSLNPRGNDWVQDSNKFGQKMLEKMGWQHGKGLGAKEDGMVEHVKVSYKHDSKGMGYKESNDQWTEHDTNFSALLESLSGATAKVDEVKVNSLEKKSQSSRVRVHYHKFTRGKDLSRYSEKDLANIFGKKSLKESKNEEETVEAEEKSEHNSNFIYNGGSMKEYFKKKLPSFGKVNQYVVGSNGVLKKDESESDGEFRPSFGLGFQQNTDFNCKKEENDVTKNFMKENKPSFVSYLTESNENSEDKPKKKKKKSKESKKQPEEKNELNGFSNLAFNPMHTPLKMQRHKLDTIEESLEETVVIEEESPKVEVEVQKKKRRSNNIEETFETPKKKRKKFEEIVNSEEQKSKTKHKNEEGIVNPVLNTTEENEYVEQIEENPYEVKVKRKKKKKKETDKAVENPAFVELTDSSENSALKKKKRKKEDVKTIENPFVVSSDNSNSSEIKLKKKKKQTETENNPESNCELKMKKYALENPSFNDSLNNTDVLEIEENVYEVKRKKKKNRTSAIENPGFSEESSEQSSQMEENPYEVKVPKKKKKKESVFAVDNSQFVTDESAEEPKENNAFEVKRTKTSKRKEAGVENPALNLSDNVKENISIDIEASDLMLNVVATPVVTKEEARVVSSTKKRKSVRFSEVQQERIISIDDDTIEIVSQKKRRRGVENVAFDEQETNLEENLDTISKTIDRYQAEIENDINEEKLKNFTIDDVMVGEVGNPHGEDEKLPEGSKLKFKNAHFDTKTPLYQLLKVGARKSYKHLIKGDIVVQFKNSNLHEIKGYAVKSKSVVV